MSEEKNKYDGRKAFITGINENIKLIIQLIR